MENVIKETEKSSIIWNENKSSTIELLEENGLKPSLGLFSANLEYFFEKGFHHTPKQEFVTNVMARISSNYEKNGFDIVDFDLFKEKMGLGEKWKNVPNKITEIITVLFSETEQELILSPFVNSSEIFKMGLLTKENETAGKNIFTEKEWERLAIGSVFDMEIVHKEMMPLLSEYIYDLKLDLLGTKGLEKLTVAMMKRIGEEYEEKYFNELNMPYK